VTFEREMIGILNQFGQPDDTIPASPGNLLKST
jgi:hypothetical protein